MISNAIVCEALQTGLDLHREFLCKNLLTPATLRLKPGALVMFTVNKNERGQLDPVFVNGQIGVVMAMGQQDGAQGLTRPTWVRVKLRDGREIDVEPFTWRYAQNDPDSATFTQFPLRLAYAMTIHKSQGLTLDAAYLDIRAAHEPGQAYVANAGRLHFKEWFKGVHVSEAAIQFYKEAA